MVHMKVASAATGIYRVAYLAKQSSRVEVRVWISAQWQEGGRRRAYCNRVLTVVYCQQQSRCTYPLHQLHVVALAKCVLVTYHFSHFVASRTATVGCACVCAPCVSVCVCLGN